MLIAIGEGQPPTSQPQGFENLVGAIEQGNSLLAVEDAEGFESPTLCCEIFLSFQADNPAVFRGKMSWVREIIQGNRPEAMSLRVPKANC